jgi:hypothetical protein
MAAEVNKLRIKLARGLIGSTCLTYLGRVVIIYRIARGIEAFVGIAEWGLLNQDSFLRDASQQIR